MILIYKIKACVYLIYQTEVRILDFSQFAFSFIRSIHSVAQWKFQMIPKPGVEMWGRATST